MQILKCCATTKTEDLIAFFKGLATDPSVFFPALETMTSEGAFYIGNNLHGHNFYKHSWPETRRTLDRLPDPRRLLACWVAAIEA